MKLQLIIAALLALVINRIDAGLTSSTIARKSRHVDTTSGELDVSAFVKKSAKELQLIYDKFRDISQQEIAGDLELQDGLDESENILFNISSIARTFHLQALKHQEWKYDLEKLQNIGGVYKLGDGVIQLRSYIDSLRKMYEIEEFYCNSHMDIKHSLAQCDQLIFESGSLADSTEYWKIKNEQINKNAGDSFFHVVKMIQNAAKRYNMTAAEFWYPNYSEKVMSEIADTMQILKPFYQKLHAYVRYKLFQKHGAGVIKPNGPIPIQLYEQVLKQLWLHSDETEKDHFKADFPLNDIPKYDANLKEHGFIGKPALKVVENFYQSIGIDSFTEKFWEHNIYEDKNTNKCTDSIDDTMPANITLKYCNTAPEFKTFAQQYVLLGRVHAAVLKKELPQYFYDGNFLGEIVGNVVKLAATTPKHLKAIGLVTDFEYTKDIMLNRNFRSAIEVMFSITYSYIGAKILTEFLNGKVEKLKLNNYYWQLLEEYAGIEPPVDRTEDELDLPYYIYEDLIDNTNDIHKFTNAILSYQFYGAICQRLGQSSMLHNCDFDDSNKEIGVVLNKMLSLGSSKPLNEIFAPLLPTYTKLDGTSLLDYFEPTQQWLEKYIKSKGLKPGWEHTTKQFFKWLTISEDEVNDFAQQSSTKIYKLYDEIAADLFSNKQNENIEFAMDTYWKISRSALAARELTDISLKAKKIDISLLEERSLKIAIKKLAQIADIFVLGDKLETLMDSKKLLQETATDCDIIKFESTEGDYVAYAPDIENIFLNSNNTKELRYYWEAWRQQNSEYNLMLLSNTLEAFARAAEILEIAPDHLWFKGYNIAFLKNKMEHVIVKLNPLYSKLHHYVRERLQQKYAAAEFSVPNGAIPEQLIQQVLLQIWTEQSIVEKDFPRYKLPQHDQIISEKSYDALKLLNISEEFYQSLGFEPLEADFWTAERLQQQDGFENATDCHASIYDMTPKVYMKYCDRVNYKKLLQAHTYMGRIHYAHEKRHLPAYFFDSHYLEYAVGEAVTLSASSTKHSQLILVPKSFEFSDEIQLNRLIRMAIHTFFKLYEYFVNTKVIADYLNGNIKMIDLNKYYWKYMVKYASIEPPLDRRDVNSDFPYEFYTDLEQNHQVKKFLSEVFGYQIYEALCKLSGHQGNLHNCDFFGSEAAGNGLKEMMSVGSSKQLKNVLAVLDTDIELLNPNALLNYFQPLNDWLDADLNNAINLKYPDNKDRKKYMDSLQENSHKSTRSKSFKIYNFSRRYFHRNIKKT